MGKKGEEVAKDELGVGSGKTGGDLVQEFKEQIAALMDAIGQMKEILDSNTEKLDSVLEKVGKPTSEGKEEEGLSEEYEAAKAEIRKAVDSLHNINVASEIRKGFERLGFTYVSEPPNTYNALPRISATQGSDQFSDEKLKSMSMRETIAAVEKAKRGQ